MANLALDRLPDLIAQAHALVQAELAPKVAGFSVAVAVGGEPVWSQSYGFADLENQIPATPATRFRIGSVSKPLTAAGLALLEQRLAACVQVQPVQSYYRWQGELLCEPEQRLLIKTSTARYAELEAFVLAHHSYQTPQIVQCPISAASAGYLAWMDDSLKP